jgi:HK97 family phage portal protein
MIKFKDRVSAFWNPPVKQVSREAATNSDDQLRATFASLSGLSDSGVLVNEETSLKFSAVWLARRVLSELPASLPLEVFEEKGNNRESIDHPIKDLLSKPSQLMNHFTWTELMNDWLQGWGNAVAVIDGFQKNGYAQSLIPIHPSCVRPVLSKGKVFYKINDSEAGVSGTFFYEEVIHYKLFTQRGLWGRDPITMARSNIGLGLAAEKFGSRFFKKGGNLKGVMEMDGSMGEKVFAAFKNRWDTYYSGEAGDQETPILEHGLKYKALGIAPEAAQFLGTRQFSIQDVSRWFNLPPHMLYDLTRSTFSNIENQDIGFVRYSLRPVIKRQEAELEDKLLLPSEKGRIRIRYNLDGMTRGDLASITTHIKEMVLSGVLSPDEGRGLLNRNPLPNGRGAETMIPANIVGNNNAQANGK